MFNYLKKLIFVFILVNKKLSNYFSKKFPSIFSYPSYRNEMISLLSSSISNKKIKPKILEVGGIDRPLIEKNSRYIYDGLDVDKNDNCNIIYDNYHCQSIEDPIQDKYGCIFSFTLLEHVQNNKKSITNIFNALDSKGTTIHYIPSKWHPYSIILRLIGNRLQRLIISFIRPEHQSVTGYKAYFSYCSVFQMKKLFLSLGFNNIKCIPYYRANDYFDFFLPLFILVTILENIAKKLNLSFFASGFIISANK